MTRLAGLRDRANRPEVAGEHRAGLGQVGIGHGEIALHTPAGSPGIAHGEPLRRVVVADREDRVAAEDLLAGPRHRDLAGLRYLLTLEAVVDGEAKDEGIAVGEAGFHQV